MHILNFSHPLSPTQITETYGDLEVQVVNIPIQFDFDAPFTPQIVRFVDAVGFTPEQWQTINFQVNLPNLSAIAAGILAEIHGRSGDFPRILFIKQTEARRYVIAETPDLLMIRREARNRRFQREEAIK